MLPAKRETDNTYRAQSDGVDIRPGSWWRLKAEDHPMAEMPAPEHGLILMVSQVRVIDGEIHTLVLHPHPLWGRFSPNGGLKFIYSDFIRDFAPEPEGAALREAEIAAAMGRVQEISIEMQTPPEPELLLERQKEQEAEKAAEAQASPLADQAPRDGQDSVENLPDTGAKVPAALLPSQDVVEAQKAIETRIAAFEAQKNWITGKTDELKSQMNLVAAYQNEKVNTTLASISEETSRAEGLLKNVQTMRLFLGEDMGVTELLSGQGADPSEPLTFMQRMLFLDEEIVINDLLEGFSDDQMDPENLTEIFSKDFSLVERMLPFPRCAAIVRVRRNAREFNTEGMSIARLFELLEIMNADKRVHILVRDGERLNMITADETTSGAERFFPSAAEINALFKTRSHFGRESREILPDTVEYSDARAVHDERALFYKRFLILMWGIHERTDVFGPFMDKGANWLAATTHSERFRFIHDEEEVLTDGRPSVADYIAAANDRIVSGSRVLAYWRRTVDGRNAPSLASEEDYRVCWKAGVDLAEDISARLVQADKSTLFVKAPALRSSYRQRDKTFDAKVTIVRPAELRRSRPDSVTHREISDGLLCLDHCTLEEIDYYANSRAARQEYLSYAHLLAEARRILLEEQKTFTTYSEILSDDVDAETLRRAMKIWRAGNKWAWPERETQRKAVLKIAQRLDAWPETEEVLKSEDGLVRAGLRSNGDIFVICDTTGRELPGGFALPWLEERIISNPKTGKVKATRLRGWTDRDEAGEETLLCNERNQKAFIDRCAPPVERAVSFTREDEKVIVPAWRISRGLFDPRAAEILDRIAADHPTVPELRGLIDGSDIAGLAGWLKESYSAYRAPSRMVEIPSLRASVAVAYAIDHNSMPRAWVIDVVIAADRLAWHHGLHDEVRDCVNDIYAHPEKIVARIADDPRGVTLHARALGGHKPLAARWQDHPCLSFDADRGHIRPGWNIPRDDARIGWKEVLASTITEPDEKDSEGFMSQRRYSAGNLISAASTIQVLAPTGGEDLLKACYEMSQG